MAICKSSFSSPLRVVLVTLLLCSCAALPRTADQSHATVRGDAVCLQSGDCAFEASLKAPTLVFGDMTADGGMAPLAVQGRIFGGKPLRATFSPRALSDGSLLEIKIIAQWSPKDAALRKWVRFRRTQTAASALLTEVVLENADVRGKSARGFPGDLQSYPVLLDGFFAGIEFPIAATRIEEDRLLLAHRPGLAVQPGVWYESRKAVYGVAPKGGEMRAFQRYIMAHHPPPETLHINYNSWWTSPCPYYTEKDILDLMATFQTHLHGTQRMGFDTFCIDMGWSDLHSLWEIDRKLFPEGFLNIQRAAAFMGCRLGLWISPSSRYPTALDNAWAAANGYEVADNAACLGGARYQTAFRERLVEMVTRYGVRHIKLDGYVPQCPATDHGHAPGPLSSEAIADGIIAAAQAVHRAAPETWLEPTCFGWNPSPWWLFYFNSVIGSYGDDAPYGRVPAPVYRESYTTARDYYNLQGACWSPVPQAAQEVLGIIHQTQEPFLNDAVMTVLRGHRFLPVYLNPKFMDETRWNAFSDLLVWAQSHGVQLSETEPLLPQSWRDGKCPRFSNDAAMPREPYGYAHFPTDGNGSAPNGLIVLRNPWVAPQTYPLLLPKSCYGNSPTLAITSLYPAARLYARDVTPGAPVEIPLAPYETVVLSVAARLPAQALPEASKEVRNRIRVTASKQKLQRVEYPAEPPPYGPSWTSVVGDAPSSTRLHLDADVTVETPQAELLVLFDGARNAGPATLRVNDKEVVPSFTSSETGWGAAGGERPEHWVFLRAALTPPSCHVSLDVAADQPGMKTSVWVWATKPGDRAAVIAAQLPQPETVSLDAVALLEPTDLSRAPVETARAERPVERIDGIFLDALEPVSVTQGWGVLQKNKSVWEKPITIAGGVYRRGLGTHAPARIVFALNGAYRRFQACAGADAATTPTITFEVWVDGKKQWESGLMQRADPPRRVDVSVEGAATLELVVGDGGNDLMGDHADWADAKLLR